MEGIQPQGPRSSGVAKCNNASIEWYGRMPTDPTLVDPKGEKSFMQCEEEATDPKTDNWPPH